MKGISMKEHFISRLKVACFVLALVGWFLLFMFIFGHFFEQQLLELEKVFESKVFVWCLRIFVLALVLFLVYGRKFTEKILKNKIIRNILSIILVVGAIGWTWWLIALLF